eukprot:GEMP01025946.1.p1 GENE.GEMP01025946.1~~GEMP01025946.1.p1  ORF type:complete len:491 (+),score=116.11 GEMP01025946.1:240-1712(+)
MTKPPIRFWALEKVKVRPRSLVETCLRRLAANFLTYDLATLTKQLGKQVDDLYQYLDLDMPLPEAATRINDENYWKRRTQREHRNCQVGKHGLSWKQAYLELDFQRSLEDLPLNHSQQQLDSLKQKIQSNVRLYIYRLVVQQFRSHADLSVLFESLPALASLSITFGDRHLGMEYERAMFGMKIADAQALARHARISQTLIALSLPCNMIDDELVKVLMSGLSFAHMLTNLDMSHNKIGDRGARRLATLLDPEYCLQSMDLSDNQIHANGCMHLGAHLAENITLESLNLRLNRCEDNGVSHLFQDLCINRCMHTLNISSNDLTQRCLSYLSSMISENSTLKTLDVSANPLFASEARWDEEEEPEIRQERAELPPTDPDSLAGIFVQCVISNTSLTKLDIRNTSCPSELEEKINTAVKHRYLKSKDIPIEAYEKVIEEEVQQEEEEAAAAAAAAAEAAAAEAAEGSAKSGGSVGEQENAVEVAASEHSGEA